MDVGWCSRHRMKANPSSGSGRNCLSLLFGPAAGNDFGLYKHVKLTADHGRTVSRQPIEIVHHVHLIVIIESIGDVSPSRLGSRRLESQSGLEPNDSGVQFRRDSNLVPKPP